MKVNKTRYIWLIILSTIAILIWLFIILFFGMFFIGGYRAGVPLLSYPPLIIVVLIIPTSVILCWRFLRREDQQKYTYSLISLILSLPLAGIVFFWVFFLLWMDALISEF